MKKTFKIIGILALIGFLAAAATFYYVFNKPHRNVEKETPAYILTAGDLYNDFSADELKGNEKYGDKVLQVSGEIVEISNSNGEVSIMLLDPMQGISCAIDSLAAVAKKDYISQLTIGDRITLKGKCDGIDMIMGVVLTRCFIVEENK